MLRIAERIEAGIPGAKVNPSRSADEKIVTKLIVYAGDAQIKIEITPVLRGTVHDPVVTRKAAGLGAMTRGKGSKAASGIS